ncbi:hypothetical protein Hte_012027 [Hypoxylon texense]
MLAKAQEATGKGMRTESLTSGEVTQLSVTIKPEMPSFNGFGSTSSRPAKGHLGKRMRAQDHIRALDSGGIGAGILRNIFLIIDQAAVNSLLDTGLVDEAWVRAIDPDYHYPHPAKGDGAMVEEYRGYFRVRLQQLVHNFFDVRRFHEDEYTMEQLEGMAQKSRNQAFVSLKKAEYGSFRVDRLIGSCLRVNE